jgi:protein-disulfide isomerase
MTLRFASGIAVALALSFTPARAQVDLNGIGHLEGRADAPVRIVEFADYSCGFCAQFSRETMPALRREWIETGRASFRFIGFHNSYFKPGRDAARAAECAADQGAFHTMHDLIFERQRGWLSRGGQRERFETWAEEIGLDTDEFRQCWDRNPSKDRLDRNAEAARDHGVRATPTFYIGARRIEGALAYDEFRAILEAEFEAVSKKESARDGRNDAGPIPPAARAAAGRIIQSEK